MKLSTTAIWLAVFVLTACAVDDQTEIGQSLIEDAPRNPAAADTSAPVPTARAETMQMQELQGSGVAGEVTLSPFGASSRLYVRLTGAPADSRYAGHIHNGTCRAIGIVAQPLDPVETDSTGTGATTTEVGLTAAELTSAPHAVVYHGTGGRPITCADLTAEMM